MDSTVVTFNDELQSLLLSKPPVSKAKMGLITKAAMKGVKFYKHIVQIVEKFIARCKPEYKVPGLYVIDSIVRQSQHQFGSKRDVYAARFARNLAITFENLFTGCSDEDRARMVRVLNLWLRNNVFDMQIIRPLLDLADPNKAASFPSDPKSPSSSETNDTTKQEYVATQRYCIQTGDKALKFSKNMLDFDYGEDDDDADETPTEAEPPLSSTLSKIEMEQRKVNNENNSEVRKHKNKDASVKSNHRSSHSRPTATKPPQPTTPKQDPVLERWNRILKGELTSDHNTFNNNEYQNHRRSRSKSPQSGQVKLPQRHKSVDHKAGLDHSKDSDPHKRKDDSSTHITNPERAAERERKCLPRIRDKHLTVCSSTLWLGHVPKTVSEVDISDAFGEFGHINSIDLIPPRGCAFVCMDRRQDAMRALSQSKRLKLNGSHIRMAWAPGKGLKEQKRWKDFWESDIGASFVPYSKVDIDAIDFDQLEDGGVIDEDSMSMEMREKRERGTNDKVPGELPINETGQVSSLLDTTKTTFNQPPLSSANLPAFVIPPPPLNLGIPPPMLLSQSILRFPPPGVNIASLSGGIQTMLPQSSSKGSLDTKDQTQQQPFNMMDQKLNFTEQQLGMLQSQNLNQQLGSQSQSLFYQMSQPDPMVYDFRHSQQQMHLLPNMIDPQQMLMFDGQQQHNPLMLGSSMLPFNQHLNMADMGNMGNMEDNYTSQTNQDF